MSMSWDGDGDRDEIMARRFKETVAVVEATDTEVFYLWKEWSNESGYDDLDYVKRGRTHPKRSWVQVNPGYGETIGHVGKMPVVISLTWVRIDGKLVLFYELSSQMQDHRMVEPWLEKQFGRQGWPKWDHGYRRMKTNAMNFGHAIEAVDESNEKKR